MSELLEFVADQANVPQCIVVAITIEDILEFDETFTVQLNTIEPDAVTLEPNSSTVTISNDDSKSSVLLNTEYLY